jgi:hypothetical protein
MEPRAAFIDRSATYLATFINKPSIFAITLSNFLPILRSSGSVRHKLLR